MADGQLVEFGFLNVVATPHPKGVYERLLKQSSNTPVNFWGDQYAAITEPKAVENEPGLFVGRLVTWTEIDPSEPAINKSRLTETSLSDLNFTVPSDVGFNGRVFYYMLNEETHVVSVELKNEFGKSISIGRAARVFDRLMSAQILGVQSEAVEVTVIPKEDALDWVLGLKRLDRIEILVKRPNADDITAKTNRIMKELDDQNVKRQEMTFSRESGKSGIDLNERNMDYAAVASDNGHVATKGKDEDGESEARSTKEYPKIVKVFLDAGQTVLASLREQAKRIRPNRGEP